MPAGSCFAVAGSGKEENRNTSYPMKACFAQPSGLAFDFTVRGVILEYAGCEKLYYFGYSPSPPIASVGMTSLFTSTGS